jgi:hypothetical protein
MRAYVPVSVVLSIHPVNHQDPFRQTATLDPNGPARLMELRNPAPVDDNLAVLIDPAVLISRFLRLADS